MKKTIFWCAGFVSALWALYILVVLMDYFKPEHTKGVTVAIESTVRVVGIYAILAILHVGCQISLFYTRDAHLSKEEKWFDFVTTILPAAAFAFAWWRMTGWPGIHPWWAVFHHWLFWITFVALVVDVLNFLKGFKIWNAGSPPVVAPPAGHH